MSTDLKSIMRRHNVMMDVCRDPDLSGDAKLFVMLAISLWNEPRQRDRIGKRNSIAEIARRAGKRDGMWWVQEVIRKDIPRYEPPAPEHRSCTAPMIRREGACGKSVISSGTLHDPITGEGTWYGFCSRHRNHKDDWEIQQQNKEWVINGRPSPPPNKGGVLCRYLDTDWPKYYEWAAPYIKPLAGAKPAAPPRPVLRLVVGGSAGGTETAGDTE